MKSVKDQQLSRNTRNNLVAVQLGPGSTIDPGTALGYLPSREASHILVIGPRARIRQGTIIYAGSNIGRNLETGHNVVIREQSTVGDNLRIWNNSTIDYGCRIGNNVKIHMNVYVAQLTTLEDNVFLAPGVCLANDIHPGCLDSLKCMQGPHIKKGAQIGINVCVLPRVCIGEYTVIGAGSVVTHDIPPMMVAYGNPARVVGHVGDLVCVNNMRERPYSHLIERLQHEHTIR